MHDCDDIDVHKRKRNQAVKWSSHPIYPNPFKNFWDELDKSVRMHKCLNSFDFVSKIAWNKFTLDDAKPLIEFMPRHYAAIIPARGMSTKY